MMNFLYKTISSLIVILITTFVINANAEQPNTTTLLYISPNEYDHSVVILTPYSDGFWFEQGPIVEPIAFAAIKKKESNLAMCSGSEMADTIIRVKPYMFYNPWAGLYYATLVATVFSAGGENLGVYTGQAEKDGPGPATLEMTALNDINKAYTLAMDDLMAKLQIKPIAERNKVVTLLPCGIIGSQLESKFTFY